MSLPSYRSQLIRTIYFLGFLIQAVGSKYLFFRLNQDKLQEYAINVLDDNQLKTKRSPSTYAEAAYELMIKDHLLNATKIYNRAVLEAIKGSSFCGHSNFFITNEDTPAFMSKSLENARSFLNDFCVNRSTEGAEEAENSTRKFMAILLIVMFGGFLLYKLYRYCESKDFFRNRLYQQVPNENPEDQLQEKLKQQVLIAQQLLGEDKEGQLGDEKVSTLREKINDVSSGLLGNQGEHRNEDNGGQQHLDQVTLSNLQLQLVRHMIELADIMLAQSLATPLLQDKCSQVAIAKEALKDLSDSTQDQDVNETLNQLMNLTTTLQDKLKDLCMPVAAEEKRFEEDNKAEAVGQESPRLRIRSF